MANEIGGKKVHCETRDSRRTKRIYENLKAEFQYLLSYLIHVIFPQSVSGRKFAFLIFETLHEIISSKLILEAIPFFFMCPNPACTRFHARFLGKLFLGSCPRMSLDIGIVDIPFIRRYI